MQPFCPETVLPHLSNNRTGQIVSACLLSRHQWMQILLERYAHSEIGGTFILI